MLDFIIDVHVNVHSLAKYQKKGFLMKLDLSKAYDIVDKYFLLNVLKAFGFGNYCI